MAGWSEIAARAVDTGFGTFGAPGSYTPSGGPAADVTVILKTPEGNLSGFDTGAWRPGRVADVRASEVAAPAEGDVLEVGGESFIVRGARADAERLVWTLDLDPQA